MSYAEYETFIHGIDELQEQQGNYDVWYTSTIANLMTQSCYENMNPITTESIAENPLSISLVANGFIGRNVMEKCFVAHAAITGFEELGGETHATIGSVIVDPKLQSQGLGFKVVKKLISLASAPAMTDKYGHVGFTAVANDSCVPLMQKAKLQVVGQRGDKQLMAWTS